MHRHRFDAISFVFGLLFLGVAVLAPIHGQLSEDVGRLIIPGAILILGIGLAVSAIASNRPSRSAADDQES